MRRALLLEVGGIRQTLTSGGVELKPVSNVALTAEIPRTSSAAVVKTPRSGS